jgi:hypothetical protein
LSNRRIHRRLLNKRIDRRSAIAAALAISIVPSTMLAQGESKEDPPWMILAGSESGPVGRWGHSLIFDPLLNRLLVIGGRDDHGTVKGDLWSFDLASNAWADVDLRGPKARSGSATAVAPDGSGFYYFGGESDDTVFGDLWWFDFAGPAWQEITTKSGDAPVKRSGVKGAIDALGRFVITHGHDGGALYDDTWAFDPGTGIWTDISPDPELRPMARYDHDLVALPDWGVILLTGGCSDGVGPCPQGDLWSLDPYGGWSDITPYAGPTPRTASAIARLDGTILQVGGMTDLGPESDVWRGTFDGGTVEWRELTLVNHGPMGIDRRSGQDMTTAGREYYVFGGNGVEGAISDLWQFSLDRFTESEHTLDPNSDFDDSSGIDDSGEYDGSDEV